MARLSRRHCSPDLPHVSAALRGAEGEGPRRGAETQREETGELPEGWAETTVGDVSTRIEYGYTASANTTATGARFLRITDIQDGRVDWATVPGCEISNADLSKYALRSGDIVFARTGATTGKSFLIRDCPESVFASYLIRLRPADSVAPAFLAAFFDTPRYWQAISEKVSGNAQPGCNASKLATLRCLLPPLAEQKRIVAKVEELLGRVRIVRERLAKVPRILKRFRQAVLAAACSGRLTADWRADGTPVDGDLPKGWHSLPLGQLVPAGGLFDGPFGSDLKTSDYASSGVRVVRLENIGQLVFRAEKETYISPQKHRTLTKHTVGQGDIIFASFISDEVRACVLPQIATKAIAKADCFCIRPVADVDRQYLAYQLVCQETHDALVGEIHGATRPRINTTQLRELDVRMCPLPEQKEIVRRVEALFKLADAIEKRVAAATARADKLTQSILAKAFRGELVPTEAELARAEGREYEPASVLLERIRKEREARGTSVKRGKRKGARVGT